MEPYPLLFEPILKPKVWGGRSLEALGKTLPRGSAIGESWELADLPATIEGGRSVIRNGALTGRTLREAIDAHATIIMGDVTRTSDGGFPLLVKYLDARENLSVQVHPSPVYAAAHPDAHLKSEAWVVIDHEPGAVIYRGLRPGATRDRFARHIATGAIVDDLQAVEVKVGDCYYLPSGTCHALGAGILVAEVQTPSDTTFRVYDWGRIGRTLHVREAMACIDFEAGGRPREDRPGATVPTDGATLTTLCATPFFEIERIVATDDTSVEIVTSNRPEVWMFIGGRGRIRCAADVLSIDRGDTVLVPAALDDATVELRSGVAVLRIAVPVTSGRMLA